MRPTGRLRPPLWAVVPVKTLTAAKQRLAAVLSAEERTGLYRAMLEDVLDALAAVPALAGVLVVTVDAEAAALAEARGFVAFDGGPDRGHTPAVLAGVRRTAELGAAGMLTLPGDVPLVSPVEIDAVLAAHRRAPAVTIVPSRDEMGSNCVACSPPGLLPLRFGDDSFRPHLAAARAQGVEPKVLRLAGFGLDIDTPDDLAALLARPAPTRAHAFLAGIGYTERLKEPA